MALVRVDTVASFGPTPALRARRDAMNEHTFAALRQPCQARLRWRVVQWWRRRSARRAPCASAWPRKAAHLAILGLRPRVDHARRPGHLHTHAWRSRRRRALDTHPTTHRAHTWMSAHAWRRTRLVHAHTRHAQGDRLHASTVARARVAQVARYESQPIRFHEGRRSFDRFGVCAFGVLLSHAWSGPTRKDER